jgi:NLI interacting factor-like phosphatase
MAFAPVFKRLLIAAIATTMIGLGPMHLSFASEKIGLELEVTTRPLSELVKYFDVPHLEAQLKADGIFGQSISDSVLENYVLDPKALASLPPDVQKELTAGLHLGSVLDQVIKPAKIYWGSEVIVQPPNPFAKEPEQKKAGGIFLPSDSDLKKFTNVRLPQDQRSLLGSLPSARQETVVPKNDWPLLLARWNAIPRERALQLLHLQYLSPAKIAEVITSIPIKARNPVTMAEYLRLNSNAPSWIKSFNWSLDGVKDGERPLEFTLSSPSDQPKAAIDDFEHLIKEAGLEPYFKNPMIHKQWNASFHIHLSGIDPARLETLTENYKRLTLIRMMAAGEHNDGAARPLLDLKPDGGEINGYETPIKKPLLGSDKGIIRLVDEGYVEIREPTRPPREVYSEFSRWAGMGEKDTTAEINHEISATLSAHPDIVKRILAINPTVLLDFEQNLPGAHVRDQVEKEIVNDIHKGADPEHSHQIKQLRVKRPDARSARFLADIGAGNQSKPIDIVFDLDDTLIRWVRPFPEEPLPEGAIPADGAHLKYSYRVLDGAPELLQSLANRPGVRISFFSLGPAGRNEEVLKKIILPDGRSAWDIAHIVLSDRDATPDGEKDLSKFNPDTSRVLIVDDKPDSTIEAHRANILRISPKLKRFYTSLKEIWAGENTSRGTTPEELVQQRNKLAFADGIIHETLDRVQTLGISPLEALTQIQYSLDSNGKLVYREDLKTDLKYYRKGAADFHQLNPKYRFTSALGYIEYIECIKKALMQL